MNITFVCIIFIFGSEMPPKMSGIDRHVVVYCILVELVVIWSKYCDITDQHNLPALERRCSCESWYDFPEILKYLKITFLKYWETSDINHVNTLSYLFTWTIRIADRRPDWIWPRWTTPCTPTTSSIPSQWFGFVNLSSFSGPHAFAPEPQLMMFRMIMPGQGQNKIGLF